MRHHLFFFILFQSFDYSNNGAPLIFKCVLILMVPFSKLLSKGGYKVTTTGWGTSADLYAYTHISIYIIII